MCGIAGLARPPLPAGDVTRVLARMMERLRHRGPDAEGLLWHDAQRVGLGHRRLSILDPTNAGAQPMVSRSGRHAIVLNGEICNAPALTRELRTAGITLRGHSDTEAALAAIEAWGLEDALPRLAGMFAMAVHDRERGVLHLVRDRLGVKPLHYAWIGGEGAGMLAFASELRALLQVPGFAPQLHVDALAGFFARSCVPGSDCIWRGVRKVPPGCRLELHLAGGGVRLHRYWSPLDSAHQDQDAGRSDAAWIEEADSLLTQVVDENLLSDAPVACFLSGGVDSTLVAALAKPRLTTLQALTVAPRDPELDESSAAARHAQALGLQHQIHHLEDAEALPLAVQVAEAFDEPFADASAMATLRLSALASRSARVALAGDGGDEVFAGYNRHRMAAALWSRTRRMPRAMRHAAAAGMDLLGTNALSWMLPRGTLGPRPGDRFRKLAETLRADSEAAAYDAVTTTWAHPPLSVQARPGSWWVTDRAPTLPDFLRRMQAMDLAGYLPDDALVKVDRASMAVGLEVRVPLLDHRLVEFAHRLPPPMKVRGGTGKWLLRQVLARRAPAIGLSSAKSGFAVPLARWLRGPLQAWARDLLGSRAIRQHPLLECHPVDACWRGLMEGDDAQAERAWACVVFAAWSLRWEASS